jgi:hypothetical protein
MASADEKQRRKALKQGARQQERDHLHRSLPLSPEALRGLFDHLDASLGEGCDHTLRLSRAYLEQHGLPVDAILPWLVEHGGSCDCEVLANVEERFS